MCNSLHINSKPIPEEGYGWKVFSKGNIGLLTMCGTSFYEREKGCEEVSWSEKFLAGDGFCFLLTRAEARKVAKSWLSPYTTIRKISYRHGLGIHREKGFDINFWPLMALCKEFTILDIRG